MNKKEIGAKTILETLTEDGFFENEWIDERKFRPRFTSTLYLNSMKILQHSECCLSWLRVSQKMLLEKT